MTRAIQPIVAATLAVRTARPDVSQQRSPFLRTLLVDPAKRRASIRSGWVAIRGPLNRLILRRRRA